ncbi:unnamed protein product, partial [Musa acuminata subsp. burmannicoides]
LLGAVKAEAGGDDVSGDATSPRKAAGLRRVDRTSGIFEFLDEACTDRPAVLHRGCQLLDALDAAATLVRERRVFPGHVRHALTERRLRYPAVRVRVRRRPQHGGRQNRYEQQETSH